MRKLIAGIAVVFSLCAWQATAAGAATIWAVGDGGDALPNDDALSSRIQTLGAFDKLLYLGDVYETGTAEEYANYYEPSFGRFKAITAPTPGNHEWGNRAVGYDAYWGSQGMQPGGAHYYSFDVAGWHIVSLNSQEDTSSTSPQVAWLRQDLARYPGTCTIAYWHRPRYTATANFSGDYKLEPLWAALENRAVANFVGHHHNYARMKPNRGITQFTAGAGGHLFHPIDPADARLDAYQDTKYGALRADLSYGRMDYQYVLTDGTVSDRGSLACTPHTAEPPPNSAPTAAFSFTPQSPSTADTVTFTSSSTDPDGTIANQAWDLDNDGQYDDATGATATGRFATAGTYTVGLQVTDDDGATATTTRQLTVGNQAPSASFSYSPAAPLRRETVTFTSTSADPDGRIVSQAWDLDNDGRFDDGTAATASRSFSYSGTYTVRLRVVDDAGAARVASRSVRVYKRRPAGAARIAAPPLTDAVRGITVPRVQILGPSPGAFLRRQPKLLRGRMANTTHHVRLTLRRRSGRACRSFDGRKFRRGSCRSKVSFLAGTPKAGTWRFRLPLDLPRGVYTLTATARADNGRLAAQRVSFRMNAPVVVKHAPPAVDEEEYEEGAHP